MLKYRSLMLVTILNVIVIQAPALSADQKHKVAPSKAQAEKLLASGEVMLAEPLVAKAKGIKTLFVTVYDAKSAMPMPYGALKIELTKDPQARVTEFKLDASTLQIMRPGPVPEKLNIKARLDSDGSAGPDQKGDLIGKLNDVAVGSQGLKITIDHAL